MWWRMVPSMGACHPLPTPAAAPETSDVAVPCKPCSFSPRCMLLLVHALLRLLLLLLLLLLLFPAHTGVFGHVDLAALVQPYLTFL